MCGGIVGALTFATQKNPSSSGSLIWKFTLYHLGRICSYILLGLLLGAIGATAISLGTTLSIQKGIALLAGLVMLFMGLEFGGFLPDSLSRIKGLSSPGILLRNAVKNESPGAWWLVGVANGFLPCGLVYAALALALNSSDTIGGATVMLFFGMGTIPALVATSWLMRRFTPAKRQSFLKMVAIAVALFGLFIILRTLFMVGEKPIVRHQIMGKNIEQGVRP
jgi:sulfite exporter TauE/SafE